MTVRSVPVVLDPTPLAPDEEYVLVPPDGGWGWLVLGGTLLVNMLIPGTIKSFGVLFVEFLEVFDASPVAASWIPALCYFLYCSLGPLASYLSSKTSYKTVTLIGGLFAASGMILSYFATSIEYLYFSYGVLVGAGAGLSFPPGIFIVTSYFVKYRGLANGLAISGSAIGSIILPPFLGYLLRTFGYRGAVLIMGGITFNVLVGALLYDPVEKHMKKVKVTKEAQNGDAVMEKVDESDENLLGSPPNNNHSNEKNSETAIIIHSGNKESEKEQPLLEQPIKHGNGSGFVRSAMNLVDPSRKVSSCSFTSRGGLGSTSQISRKISAYSKPHNMGSNCQISRNYSVASNMSSSSFRYVSTAFHGSTLVGLHPEFSSNPSIKEPPKSSTCFTWLKKWRSKKLISREPKQTNKNSTSYLSLLKDPTFIIILLSNATNAIGYTNFTILVPAYAMSLGFDKVKASYLLSIVATLDLVGRIGGSALSDFLKLDKRFYYVGGLFVSGISLALLPYFTSYNSVSAMCAVFGLASGTYVGVTAVIMVDMLGEELLASSYGLSLFLNGVLQLIGPPICGVIFESIQTYGPIFNGLGLSLVFGAALWAFIPLLDK